MKYRFTVPRNHYTRHNAGNNSCRLKELFLGYRPEVDDSASHWNIVINLYYFGGDTSYVKVVICLYTECKRHYILVIIHFIEIKFNVLSIMLQGRISLIICCINKHNTLRTGLEVTMNLGVPVPFSFLIIFSELLISLVFYSETFNSIDSPF